MMARFPEHIRSDVKSSIRSAMQRKMEGFNPETKYMPFHTRLLGRRPDASVFLHPISQYQFR